jgi:hypothetical protein
MNIINVCGFSKTHSDWRAVRVSMGNGVYFLWDPVNEESNGLAIFGALQVGRGWCVGAGVLFIKFVRKIFPSLSEHPLMASRPSLLRPEDTHRTCRLTTGRIHFTPTGGLPPMMVGSQTTTVHFHRHLPL